LADLLRGLFVLELLEPSSSVYLVSAWVTNIEILDNRDGSYSGLDRDLPTRRIYLAEVLVALALRGSIVSVVTNEDPHNQTFLSELQLMARTRGCRDQVRVRTLPDLHTKGLATDSFHLFGSMNFTYNGINVNGEEVLLLTDANDVQRAQIDYHELYFKEADQA